MKSLLLGRVRSRLREGDVCGGWDLPLTLALPGLLLPACPSALSLLAQAVLPMAPRTALTTAAFSRPAQSCAGSNFADPRTVAEGWLWASVSWTGKLSREVRPRTAVVPFWQGHGKCAESQVAGGGKSRTVTTPLA